MKKFAQVERKSGSMPLILKLDVAGQPRKWISWEDSVVAAWTGKVLWSMGEPIVLKGGINAATGTVSEFDLYPIIAVNESAARLKTPALTNSTLFKRDGHMCMYCGNVYPASKLTRDHIMPTSRGGKDTWANTISACDTCNHIKSNRTPEEAGMKLLAVPYVPTPAESLILQNRKITGDQMEFLKAKIPADSRFWKNH